MSGDWMQTYTGRKFWPFDPRAEAMFLERFAELFPGVVVS